jgi:hypothetical protein
MGQMTVAVTRVGGNRRWFIHGSLTYESQPSVITLIQDIVGIYKILNMQIQKD